jgi:hypothetical protein
VLFEKKEQNLQHRAITDRLLQFCSNNTNLDKTKICSHEKHNYFYYLPQASVAKVEHFFDLGNTGNLKSRIKKHHI